MSELLLMNAARHDLVERVIKPALRSGKWVLADRFADSSRAYQIAAGGLRAEVAEPVIQAATGGLEPDVTVLLQIPMEQAFERIEAQGGDERRFEAMGLEFQKRALSAFYALSEQFPQRVAPVSALGSVDEVTHRIWSLFTDRDLFAAEQLGQLMVNASTTPEIKIAPEYLGQESVRSQLHKAIEGGRLSRSLLLSGPTGSGRKSLAYRLAVGFAVAGKFNVGL